MQNLEEQYENLYDFIKNLEILIEKNIFQERIIEEVSNFGNEVMTICKSKNSTLVPMILNLSIHSMNLL